MIAKLRWISLSITTFFLAWLAMPSSARAESVDVNFTTSDGVLITGKFYSGAKGKDLPTVLCLHGFTHKKGGSSTTKEWEGLALALQKEGHSVLTFDFRGHGKSTIVSGKFWEAEINKKLPGALKTDRPRKISYTDFTSSYYPNLVNDIAAAKCFLDARNDSLEANTSNLVVVGAGEGATLGALWMASEWRRQPCEVVEYTPGRPANFFIASPPTTKTSYLTAMTAQDPEGAKQLAAIWLTINPTVAGKTMGKLPNWLKDVTMKRSLRRVQTVFVSGKEDKDGDEFSYRMLKIVKPGYVREKKDKEGTKKGAKTPEDTQGFTGEYTYASKMEGDQLLPLATKDIVDYMAKVGKKEVLTSHKKQGLEESTYGWFFGDLAKDGSLPLPPSYKGAPFHFNQPTTTGTGRMVWPAKVPSEKESIRPLPFKYMGVN
ncbi:MAG: hypothetical protein EXR99_12365 [Gemmataceae bacterium]|nr:hypothetical protein [Gemmataceae bacterium]